MQMCVTFQEKRHEGNLGRLHSPESFPVGFVVQRGILKTQAQKLKNIKQIRFSNVIAFICNISRNSHRDELQL